MAAGRLMILSLATTACLFNVAFGIRLLPNSKTSKTPHNEPAPCGQVRCLEFGAFSSVTVFKHTETDGGVKLVSLGSVTRAKRAVNTVSENIRVVGTWTGRKAEISVYPLHSEDCQDLTLSCLMVAENGDGETRETFATVGKPGESLLASLSPAAPPEPEKDRPSSSEVGMAGLAVHLSSMMSTFGSDLRHQQERLEDKICNISETLVKIEDRLSSKTCSSYNFDGDSSSSSENRLEYALNTLQAMQAEMDILEQVLDLHAEQTNYSTDSDDESEEKDSNVPSEDDIVGIARQSFCKKKIDNDTDEQTLHDYRVVYSPQNKACFLCDTVTDGGGWIFIQRRLNGEYDFFKTWESYKDGFGSLASDFWLGNDKIHALTYTNLCELNVTFQVGGSWYWAHYDSFYIESEADNYRLRLGRYRGTAGDMLTYHNGQQFSTWNRENDRATNINCAIYNHGAWWYNSCQYSNLNGRWGDRSSRGIRWRPFIATYTEMKIRFVYKGL